MGFDIYGLKPQENLKRPAILDEDVTEMSEFRQEMYFEIQNKWRDANPGVYFRNNCWYWRPLWAYVCHVCDHILTPEEQNSGCYNDGLEIEQERVELMVIELEIQILMDNHIRHEEEYTKRLNNLPLEECNICGGAGHRDDVYHVGECNVCKGSGKRKHFDTKYPFSAQNVEDFVKFLSQSGGIQIF